MGGIVISKSPLRISLGGGGTDLPSYYQEFEGFFVSAAINQYVYVTVSKPFREKIYLKYSQFEECESIVEIKHPIIREVLRLFDSNCTQIEISVFADIPAGTGLGSSGSFTTALLKAMATYYRQPISTHELAELACKIEIEILGEPVGKQDQYISAFGGISSFNVDRSGYVKVSGLKMKSEAITALQENLMLFYTGVTRRASHILKDQVSNFAKIEMQENLHKVKELGFRSKSLLESGDLNSFANLLSEQWTLKRDRSQGTTSDFIDQAYENALEAGAAGGKLIGAGGGGFLMLYSEPKSRIRDSMKRLNMPEVPISFDYQGTRIIN